MMLEKPVTNVFVILIVCCCVRAQVGERCILKSSGKEGVCTISSNCPLADEQAKRGIESTLCGFYELTIPIVCCERNNFNAQPNENSFLTDQDTISFPEENNPPQQVASHNNVRISESKCEEYSRSVTGTVQVIPLLTNTEPISFKVEKCDYNSVPLIVGGEPASAGEFPFMAVIGFNSADFKWRCGGTLISHSYVLTAAHCTFTRDAGPPTIVRLGDLDLSSDNDGSQHEDYAVANIIIHPRYKYPQKYNDIALIQTARRVEFTKFIRPACLYTKDTINQESGVATGWGQTGFAAERSDRLMKVTLNLYDNRQCARSYNQNKKALPRGITSSMLCAGELNGGHDTCQGDSGGPLLITKVGNQCKFYIIGVTSFGKSCGQINTPAVYTKISEYVPWIEQTIW